MVDQASGGGQGAPPFFSTVKGWIVGLSGIVVALAGLLGAYKELLPDKKTEAAKEAAAPVAAVATPTEPEADAPLRYEGDDATLEWIDEKWVLVTSEGRWEYEDMYSKYEGYVLAFDRKNDAYLRWPINGGQAEEGESDDGQLKWKEWIKLYPPEPAEGA